MHHYDASMLSSPKNYCAIRVLSLRGTKQSREIYWIASSLHYVASLAMTTSLLFTQKFVRNGIRKILSLSPLFFFFGFPSFASAAETFSSFVGRITGIISLLIPLTFVCMFLAFTWSAIQVILSADPNTKGKGDAKAKLLWGVIVLFVSLSVWSIVQFLFNALLK